MRVITAAVVYHLGGDREAFRAAAARQVHERMHLENGPVSHCLMFGYDKRKEFEATVRMLGGDPAPLMGKWKKKRRPLGVIATGIRPDLVPMTPTKGSVN